MESKPITTKETISTASTKMTEIQANKNYSKDTTIPSALQN
jgi:hypothetical protein